jgi:transposase InsO family protein
VLIRRDSLEAVLVIDALGMATSHRTPAPGAIHHSDRGSQYGAAVYGRTLRESGPRAWAVAAQRSTTPPAKA